MVFTAFILEYWYFTLLFLAAGHFIGKHVYTNYLMRKHHAEPILDVVDDGAFGFKFGFQALKAKKIGKQIDLLFKKFNEAKHPSIGTFVTRSFGMQFIATKDPENIKAMLATQFNDFTLGQRLSYFAPLLGKGIFTLDGEGWKHSRAMLRPQFSRDQVGHVKMLEPHFQLLKKHIIKNKGSFFDIQELFFRFTVDSATEFLFGESVSSLKDESIGYDQEGIDFAGRKDFAEAFNKSQVYLSTRSLLQSLYWLVNSSDFKRCNKIVHKFSDYYIKKALTATPEELEKHSSYIFLYELAKQTRDPIVLRDQSLNILLAGRDTTAGLLSFAVFELGRNPEVWSKLRQEIGHKFGLDPDSRIEDISFELLKSCEYLKAVINETLRLYPSVPRNGRFAAANTTLPHGGGPDGMSPILVRKGQTVMYSVYALQRDEKYYGKDANEFRPERWFEPEVRKLGWAFLPFNGGPRICLGQQFALTEASYVLVRLIQSFETLELSPDAPYPPAKLTHLTMCLFDGAPVRIE
ncbi:Cytochrome P450 52A10 [Candida maltosa Xu316]|uniref:Cytochrome P450 52A10 n=1 Tax=Candida maltosa (strain Xu316) TaxID=1245528 RepID=M3K5V3_CANMX|nr:Cytochrome P450 52A10 [Candida maltosa Xu316]